MLVRHTFLYLPAQVMAPLAQFVSIIAWAHLLSAADLGVVTMIITIQELAFSAFFMWWSHFALRYIAGFRDAAERKVFLGAESAAIVIAAILQMAITTPLMIVAFPTMMNATALIVAMLFMLTRSLNAYMSERARAEAFIARYTIMQTAAPFFGLLIGLALIAAGHRSPTSVLLGFVIAQAGGVGVMIATSDFGRRGIFASGAVLRRAAAFGVPVMMASMLALVAVSAPRFIVEHFEGLSAVGVFSIGYGLGLRASSFAVMVVTAGSYPLVVRKMELEGVAAAYEQLAKNMILVALVVAPVALGLLAVNRSVVELLVPPSFREVTMLVLPFATIGGLLRYLRAHTTDQVFLVRSRPGFNTMIGMIDLVCAAASSLIGLHFWGVAGAAAGPMVSGAATFSTSFLLARRILDFRVPVRSFVAIGASAAIMAVVVAAMPPGPGFFGLLARAALGALIYVAAILALLPIGRRTMVSATRKLVERYS